MAQIREYREQAEASTGRGALMPRASAPENIGASARALSEGANDLARGVNHLTGAWREREEEEARAWSAVALSKARLDWSTNLIERQAQAQPGAPDFTPSFLRDFETYQTESVGKAPTKTAQRFLTERLADLKADLSLKALTFEAQARIDHRTDQFTSAISNTQRLMNTDPGQYQTVLAEQLAVIDASSIPPVKKSELRQKAIDQVSSAAVWSQIQKSPTAFLESIGFLDSVDPATGKMRTRKSSGDLTGVTGNAAFDAMPFDRRAVLFEQAIKLKAQIDTDAERIAVDQRKKLGTDAMQNAWSLVYDNKLGAAKVYAEKIRPLISAAEYHSLRAGIDSKAKGDGTGLGQKTDPVAFRDLMDLVRTGKDDEAASAAMTYHRNGRLSNEHLGSFVRNDRRAGPKTEYDMSRSLISRSLEPGAMVNDPVARGRQAEALDAFDRWVKENGSKAGDEGVRKRGQEIISQYRFINLQDTVLGLPMPRSGIIRRTPGDAPGMQADIVKAGQEAKKRYDNKQLTASEYQAEVEILNRWRRALEK